MKVYGSNAIRNVAFVGHGASGKTSLVDALAWVAGSSRRHGTIKDGTTLTDYSPDEIDRKHSINLALGYAEWLDTKINLIDTPGYLDYFGEVVTGLHAADAAVVVLSGTSGVEVGTEKVWEVCDQRHLPRMLFVSMMDKDHADFERVFQDVKAHLTPKVVPVEVPVGDGPDFHGIINLFSGHCHFYKKGTAKSEYEVVPIPPEYEQRYREYNEQLIEAVASTDDELIERYLGGEEMPREQFIGAVKKAMLAGQIVPLFCGSATLTYGMRTLLKKMVELFPSPAELSPPVEAPLVGSGVQDALRGARGRRHPVPAVQRRAPQRRRGVERRARDGGEAEPSLHPAGQGAARGGAPERRRHRLGGQAQRHAHGRHLLPPRTAGAAAADPPPGIGGHVRGGGEAAGRGGQARRRPAQAARGGSDLPLRVQLGAGTDPHPRDGRAALRDHPEPAGAEVRGPRRAGPAPRGLPRDDQGQGGGPGQAQEADRTAAASMATAGCGSRRFRAEAATNSWTASSAA